MANADESRSYVSPLRARQAQQTRWDVLRAAQRLFTERGYVGTSIADIAHAAGVSRATVTASVGAKPALLKAAYDTALAGDDEPVPMSQRRLAPREARDPQAVLDTYASLVTTIGDRLGGIAEAVRGAAGADADARQLWLDTQRQRRIGAGFLIAKLREVGHLRRRLDPDMAADVVWVLNDATLYHSLVTERGWSKRRFHAWIRETLHAQLLDPPTSVESSQTG